MTPFQSCYALLIRPFPDRMRDGLASIDRRDRPQFYIVGTSGGTRAMKTNQSVPRLIHGVMSGKQKLDISVGGKPHSVLIPVCGVANLTQSRSRRVFAGDRFAFTITNEETPDVLVSTLHAIPDYDTLQCKSSSIMQVLLPIVFIRYELPPFMIRLRPLVPPPLDEEIARDK